MTGARLLRLATRGSPLARAQAALVADALAATGGAVVERVVVRTEGDRRPEADLERIGGQGVFVKEVQAAVLDGRADVAVHSAKDLPPVALPGLVLAAVPPRADPRDALVGGTLEGLRPGAVVATGSARRRAQLANLRPDLVFVGLRGNMDRRLGQVGDGVDAVVVAAAALDRLGWADRIAERLPTSWCLPQVGQGALAVECREDDGATSALLAMLDDESTHRALDAERAFLRALGAGCALPVAGWAVGVPGAPGAPGALELRAMVASGDGRIVVRDEGRGADPATLGEEVARRLMGPRGGASVDDAGLLGAPAGLDLGAARPRRTLGGRTVVVTRPEPGGAGDRLTDALRAAGARVLAVPAVEIVEPADAGAALGAALGCLDDYRWVAFTSQHAVERFFSALSDVRALGGVRVAAVGTSTAAALAVRGVVADLVPGRPSAAGLADAFAEAPRGMDGDAARVLFPCAEDARPTLPAGLRAKGWAVDRVVAYRTAPAAPPPAALLPVLAAADAVTFSAPSAVRAYRALRTDAGDPLPVPSLVVAVGGVTAAAARDAGLEVALEVPVGDPDALVAGLAGLAAGTP